MVEQTLSLGSQPPALVLPTRILILYASQTGQAESISEFIYKQFYSGTLKPVLESLQASVGDKDSVVQRICSSNFEEHKDFFELSDSLSPLTSYLLIVVASTTGQGDPPDTSLKFYRYLKKLQRSVKVSKETPFSHIQFALLGLGDTNYDNFAQYSKNLNRMFQELGATTFVDTKYADDAGELETVTEPFIENLSTTLLDLFPNCKPTASDNRSISELKMESKDEESVVHDGLVSSLKTLKISEKSEKIEVSSLPKAEILKSDSRFQYEKSHPEKIIETNKYYQSLRGPFEPGEDGEYRKMPQAKIFQEELSIIDDQPTSLLKFFQNKHNETIVYDAFVEIVSEEILSESSSINSLLQDKITYKAKINFSITSKQIENVPSFIPGDSYGIYCMNSLSDIFTICRHSTFKRLVAENEETELNLLDFLTSSDEKFISKFGYKQQKEVHELFTYLCYCVDSRTLIKRRDLFQFSQLATKPEEASALREISTRKSNKLYDTVILPNLITVCDILRLFPSIRINILILIGMLNPAKPRYFSLSHQPVIDKDKGQQTGEIWVALKNELSRFEERADESLLGQFSGKFFLANIISSHENISQQLQKLFASMPNFHCSSKALAHKVPIFVFLRPNTFSISVEYSRPSLFFSAGTGLSPFLFYFKSRNHQKKKGHKDAGNQFSPVILFHGARTRDSIIESSALFECFDKDDDYKEGDEEKDLLFLCFSRQKADVLPADTLERSQITLGRVPDSLQKHSEPILKLIQSTLQINGSSKPPLNIYICGGKSFENDVKAKLKLICEQSPTTLPTDYWNSTLSKYIQVDQW